MAEAAQHAQHEFWRSPLQTAIDPTGLATDSNRVEACDRCGTEFMVGSRFCHTCGTGRAVVHTSPWWGKVTLANFTSLAEGLGLSMPAFIAFLIGIACVLAAGAVGVVFSTQKVIDWQAVQLWRIQWLLGAVAAFVAGCLLKKTQ